MRITEKSRDRLNGLAWLVWEVEFVLVKNVIYGCIVPLLLADGKSPQLQMRANNNKGGEFVKHADKSVIIINGDHNNVKVNCSAFSKTPVAVLTIAVVTAAILVVSHYCPELLDDFVRWIIRVVSGG